MKTAVKNSYIVLAVVISLVSGVYFLRQNNLESIRLVESVRKADQQNQNVETALSNLQSHIFTHMNSQLAQPVDLVYSYNRAVKAEIDEYDSSIKEDTYKQAVEECADDQETIEASTACLSRYLAKSSSSVSLNLPDEALYSYEFVSPVFSADWAGISLAISMLLSVWLIWRIATK